MWLVSPKPEGVYVSTPHEKWTRVTPSSVACAVVNLLLMGVAAWSTQQDQASSVKIFSVCIGAVTLGRILAYARIDWAWYFLDYCVFANAAVVWFLLKPAHTDEEMAQYFVVITGVGIFALQLKSKCLLHHWECASSWWIHVGLIWLTLAMRNWKPAMPAVFSFAELMLLFVRVYLPWWLSYFALVIVRDAIELPMSLSQSPCLVDDFMGGAKPPLRLKFKFMAGHGLLAMVGGAVGCLCYQHPIVHALWVLLTLASSVFHATKFYQACLATKAVSNGHSD